MSPTALSLSTENSLLCLCSFNFKIFTKIALLIIGTFASKLEISIQPMLK